MHHHLRGTYGKHQHSLIHLYMNLAKLTKIPLIGRFARWVANTYAVVGHGGYLLTLQEAEQIVDIAARVAIGPCSCREEFRNCNNPVMSEIVLSSGITEVYAKSDQDFHEVSKEEAKEVLRKAHQNGLIQSIMRCGDHFYSVCNCCSCCCVPLRLLKQYGVGKALIRNPNVISDFEKQTL